MNGQTWPYLDTEQRRYRFRLLNGCQSRFLVLGFNEIPGVEVWQIGAEGGFLPEPVNLTANRQNRLLMAPAERADVIVDFTDVPVGPPAGRPLSGSKVHRSGEPAPASARRAPVNARIRG